MASVIIGGRLTSMIFILVLVPFVYLVVENMRARVSKRIERSRPSYA